MATSFKFYHDSALTSEITSGNPLTATQVTSGALPYVDKTIYFGSTATGMKAQVTSDPGVTAIAVSISDADGGTGSPSTEIKLASSPAGLAGATAGAALTLTTQVLSGVSNAVPISVRRASVLTVAGAYTDLTLVTQDLTETPV